MTTTGAQKYGGDVVLGTDTALRGSAVNFVQRLDGLFGLQVFATGNTTFGGLVGSIIPLTGLSTDFGGATFIQGGGVTTVGSQSYGDDVVITTGTALNGGGINFDQTLNGTFDLQIITSGNATFGGLVGNSAALASLTTSANSTTNINGGGVTTLGGQDYTGIVTLGGVNPTTLNASAVAFRKTLDGANDLTINAGTTTFGNEVGSLVNLASLTVGRARRPSTAAWSTHGRAELRRRRDVQPEHDAVGGFDELRQQLDGAFALTISAPGSTTFGGLVGSLDPLASLTVGPGTTAINGGGVATTGAQRYQGGVTLGTTAILGGQSVTFDQTLDGPGALTINADGGNATFSGLVGGNGSTGTPLLSLTVNATTGTIQLNGGGVRTLDFQTYNNQVTLGQPVTTLASVNGTAISFASTVDGASDLRVNTSGNTVFNGAIGGNQRLLSLTTDAGGTTFLRGGSILTTGLQTYGDAVSLGKDTTLMGTDITFGSKLDGLFALEVRSSGTAAFNGLVGSGEQLTGLTVNPTNPGASVQFNMTLDGTARAGVLVNGPVTVSGTSINFNVAGSSLTQPTVFTLGSGTQRYNGGVTLTASTALVSANALPATAGGALTGGGQVFFSAGVSSGVAGVGLSVRTRGGDVILPANVTAGSLDIGDADVSFGGEVNLRGLLSIEPNAGVGGTIRLGLAGVQTINVQTNGVQTFNAAVLLNAANTLFAANASGDITFNSTLDGNSRLTIDTDGRTTLQGAVGSTANRLQSMNITGQAFVNGGQVYTTAEQIYSGVLTLKPTAVQTTTLDSSNNDVLFYGNVLAQQSGLFVGGVRIAARGNMSADGNLQLDARGSVDLPSLIVLEGTEYSSKGGSVIFNSPRSTGSDAGTVATVVLSNSGKTTISAADQFTMGYLQKLFSFGSLSITAKTATVGDIAARDTLRIGASTINLLARPPGNPDIVPAGESDGGLNFVAVNGIDFGSAQIRFDSTYSTNQTASFITSNSSVTIQRIQGISLFRNPGLDKSQFSNTVSNYLNVVNPQAGREINLDRLNNDTLFLTQPIGGGTLSLDTAAALSGALPDQKPVDVAAEITITASQMEELKKLGIHPRLAQKSERRASGKRALFAQLVDGQDPENYGRLQPIKGGISRLEPSDYVVVVDRMGEREVSSILQSFEQVYGKNKERAPEIGAAFQTAFTDYTVQKQTADPAGFGPFLEKQKANKYPAVNKATRDFDDLFGHIEHLGLTDKEVFKSEEHIVSDLGVSGVSPADMVRVINGLRKKLPPGQQAPSTKVPQSIPASNPAPGASSPAGTPAPAPKKVPLKTADREQENAPVKSARRAPAREKARPELAGL